MTTAPAPIKPAHLLPLSAFEWSKTARLALGRFLFEWERGMGTTDLQWLARRPPDEIAAETGMQRIGVTQIRDTIRAHVPRELQGAWAAPESERGND